MIYFFVQDPERIHCSGAPCAVFDKKGRNADMHINIKILFVIMAIIVATVVVAFVMNKKFGNKVSDAQAVLEGEHTLRMIGDPNSTSPYFAFSSFGSDGQETGLVVNFFWKMNDGAYVGSALPINKIRLNFDNNATVPKVKFRWLPCKGRCKVDTLVEAYVLYMVVTLKESDWPAGIQPSQ